MMCSIYCQINAKNKHRSLSPNDALRSKLAVDTVPILYVTCKPFHHDLIVSVSGEKAGMLTRLQVNQLVKEEEMCSSERYCIIHF